MSRHIPIQERTQTFKIVATLRGSKQTFRFDVIARDAREALKKAITPDNLYAARKLLGDGELFWEVVEDFF